MSGFLPPCPHKVALFNLPPGRGGLIQAFANNHVLEEAERNLLLKALKKLNDYYRLIKQQLQKLALLALTQSLLKIRRIATGQRYARPCGCWTRRPISLFRWIKTYPSTKTKNLTGLFKFFQQKNFLKFSAKDLKSYENYCRLRQPGVNTNTRGIIPGG